MSMRHAYALKFTVTASLSLSKKQDVVTGARCSLSKGGRQFSNSLTYGVVLGERWSLYPEQPAHMQQEIL